MNYIVGDSEYEVVNMVSKNRRSIATMFKGYQIIVKSPYKLSKSQLLSYLLKSDDFLTKNAPNKAELKKLHLFGNAYDFFVYKSNKNYMTFVDDRLNIYVTSPENIKKVVSSFYKKEIKKEIEKVFIEVLNEHKDINFIPTIEYRYAKSYLGKCYYQQKKLVFSGYLAKYDKGQIIPTIHHELSHFIHNNHGKNFYKYLSRFVPETITHKKVNNFQDIY